MRRNAIQGLGKIVDASYVSRVFDILGQLLMSASEIEVNAATTSMTHLLQERTQLSLAALFKQISADNDDEGVRSKVLNFILNKIPKDVTARINQDEIMQEFLLQQVKESASGLNEQQFKNLFAMVARTSLFRQKERADELVTTLANLAGVGSGAAPTDIGRLGVLFQMAIPYVRRGGDCTAFLNATTTSVLPIDKFDSIADAQRTPVLRAFSSACTTVSAATAAEYIPPVYALLKHLVPSAPTEAKIEFSAVEALLLALHSLGAKDQRTLGSVTGLKPNQKKAVFTGQPDMFSVATDDNPEEARAVKQKLQALCVACEAFRQKLEEVRPGV